MQGSNDHILGPLKGRMLTFKDKKLLSKLKRACQSCEVQQKGCEKTFDES
jgi:hypothetical protein